MAGYNEIQRHPERSKHHSMMFTEPNPTIGRAPLIGAGSTEYDMSYRKLFADPTFGALPWVGFDFEQHPTGVLFSAQDDVSSDTCISFVLHISFFSFQKMKYMVY